MANLVNSVREVEISLGHTKRILSKSELEARKMIRRSIVTKSSISKGEKVTLEKIKFDKDLIKYPEKPSGDTIKAPYVIQMFHLMVFMCFDYLNDLKKRRERLYNLIFFLLLLVYLHNIPSMVTNYLK